MKVLSVEVLYSFPGALKYFEILDGNYKYGEACMRCWKCFQIIDRYKNYQALVRYSAYIIDIGAHLTIVTAINIDLVNNAVMN